MKLLYIACPFSHEDPIHGIARNILAASEVALEAARKGWMPISPHKLTADFQHATDIDPDFWYVGDLELMLRCDAVLLLDGWEHSKGAWNEAIEAKQNGIPVYHIADGMPIPGMVR